MPTPLLYPVSQNALQKTLDASLLTGVTASATLNNVTSIQNLKGIMVIDRLDGNNNLTPDKREYISFAGTSGSTVVTLVRGLGGSTDQDHAVGAIVEFVNDVVQQQAIIDGLLNVVDTSGAIKTGIDFPSPTFNGIVDGWISANGTWAYASASTITVSSGAAAKYAKGDRIKWTQTTVKYGVIIAVADTLLTIAVNTDYVVTNAAITLNYYSHQTSPIGYPQWFSWTPAYTSTGGAFTNAPATVRAIYEITGNKISVELYFIYNATSGGSGSTRVTGIGLLPFADGGAYETPFFGRQTTTGKSLSIIILNLVGVSTFDIALYDYTTCIANSAPVVISGFYRI